MHLAGQTEADLAAWATSRGASRGGARVLARTLVAGLAGRPVREPPARGLFAEARSRFETDMPAAAVAQDADGTVRFAVRLGDGNLVETVAIHQPASPLRAKERWTVCLSSQVGCARGCVFCETGRLGLVRNLDASEIVLQYALVARHLGFAPPNVVFMGMGEPLDNLEAVLRAVAVLREPAGFGVPERRITVSTVGIVPRMDDLFARSRVNLAVSLHAVDPAARLALLPVARRFSLGEVRADCAGAAHGAAAMDAHPGSERFGPRGGRAGGLRARPGRSREPDPAQPRSGSAAGGAAARPLPRLSKAARCQRSADAPASPARSVSRRRLRSACRIPADTGARLSARPATVLAAALPPGSPDSASRRT